MGGGGGVRLVRSVQYGVHTHAHTIRYAYSTLELFHQLLLALSSCDPIV